MTRNFPPISLPNTEVRHLQSEHVAQEYKLFIQLPDDYATSTETYPVLYVLDANWIFTTLSHVASWLHFDTDRPPIMVGIGYPTDDFGTQIALRARDYTPTRDPADEAKNRKLLGIDTYTNGGADDFLRFIREELFPFIESDYRAEPQNRTLIGYSYGGLFGMHTLLTQPEAFQRYILCSPDLEWDDRVIFKTETACAEKLKSLDARVYMAVGGLEEQLNDPTISSLYRMTALLKSREYAGLALTQAVYEDEPHTTIVSASIARGLRWVFEAEG